MESMVVQAAIEGQGVALTSNVLAADDIRAGRLVRPFEISVGRPESFAYYVVAPQWKATQPKVKAFRDWVIAESRRQEGTDQPAAAPTPAAAQAKPARRSRSG
jgi:LysR family glycine cleavage system transcriptional activator